MALSRAGAAPARDQFDDPSDLTGMSEQLRRDIPRNPSTPFTRFSNSR
jgi:hypothetical protein